MSTMTQINIENGMEEAWKAGINGYQPVFRGQALAVECCDPEVSLQNLLKLLDAGLHPKRFRTNADRSILIEFEEGGSYLATGFSVGDEGVGTAAFAEYATAIYGVDPIGHYYCLSHLDFEDIYEDGGVIGFSQQLD